MTVDNICNQIYIIRGQQVMLDYDLAGIYGYEVKRLNEQVKRNIARFPEDFITETNWRGSCFVYRKRSWKKRLFDNRGSK